MRPLLKFLCIAFGLSVTATTLPAADDLSGVSVEKLIDDLALIDSQAPGLHGTASVFGFIAEDKPLRFGGGVLGSVPPKTVPQMRELVRRGPSVLAELISHLGDERRTKLTIGSDGFFMFRFFSDEYDPKDRSKKKATPRRDRLEKAFDGSYTVKVGDVCYALIGQIVNRDLSPVRYQATAGLVINSPIETPSLIESVKKDWDKLDAAAHKASLIADAKAADDVWRGGPALVRLRFYYPDEYKRLKDGELQKRILQFETDENKQR